ncbi:MAG: lipocalin family protein [Alloprevotella sp.]|nr:lipocalin family protein [Prevotella sp.]MBR1712895.1 lipocalin family protein [Alloprevotella sp.]
MKNTFSLLIALLGLVAACNRLTVNNTPVKDLDLQRYLGTWYEVARFDHRFERGVEQARAEYSLQADGSIRVLNSGVKDGEPSIAEGKAKLTETTALLRVSFFGPFYSDYRVLLVDSAYQYALVGSGADDYLWLLSRTPQLTDSVRAVLLNEATRRGYDTRKLLWIKH